MRNTIAPCSVDRSRFDAVVRRSDSAPTCARAFRRVSFAVSSAFRSVVLSAFVFCIGAGGLLTRRNPLVILLCLELMLNAGNLALLAFSRMWGTGDGQVFALIVMVVAACEVVVGLGLIVAMFRRRLPLNVDEMRDLRG